MFGPVLDCLLKRVLLMSLPTLLAVTTEDLGAECEHAALHHACGCT